MIQPNGKSKNIEASGNDESHDPRSPKYVPEFKNKQAKSKDRSWATPSATTKLTKDTAFSKGASIGSARAGGLSDIGGSVKQMHTAVANSIWDAGVIAQLNKQKDNGEKIREEKAKNEQKRVEAENKYNEAKKINWEDVVKNTKKGASISPVAASDNSNYNSKIAPHEMSIFDKSDKDYSRLPEKTVGETIKESAAARRNKRKEDSSWKETSSQVSAKQKLRNLFTGK